MALFDKDYRIKEKLDYYDKCLYFTQYIGQHFGSTADSDELSYRRIWCIVGSATYYSFGRGAWGHIGNHFLWLRTIKDLNRRELSALDKTIFPKRPRDSTFCMMARCGEVIYRTKPYDFMEEDLYTVDVHLKMISLRMATTWFDGGKTKEKISIEKLIERGWIASPQQIKKYEAYYKEKI